jgi:hypothetical protein
MVIRQLGQLGCLASEVPLALNALDLASGLAEPDWGDGIRKYDSR